jgi:hypothetical protein
MIPQLSQAIFYQRECFKSGDGGSYGVDIQGIIFIYIHV